MNKINIRRLNGPFDGTKPVCVVCQSTKARHLFPDGLRREWRTVWGNLLEIWSASIPGTWEGFVLFDSKGKQWGENSFGGDAFRVMQNGNFFAVNYEVIT